MATIDSLKSSTTLPAPPRPTQGPVEPSRSTDNRAVAAQRSATQVGQQDQTQQANAQSNDAVRVDIRSREATGTDRANPNERERQPERQEARTQPSEARAQSNPVPFNFNASGVVQSSSNPNQAGRNISLSV